MIVKTSQIMFQNLILFFNLFIDLKIKNCIKFAFKSRVKNERWSKIINKQIFFIEYNVFK